MIQAGSSLGRDTWRRFLFWAHAHPKSSWALALWSGVCLVIPWAVLTWDEVLTVQASLTEQATQRQELAMLERRHGDLRERVAASARWHMPSDRLERLTGLAQRQGLLTSGLTVGQPLRVTSTERLDWALLPVSLRIQGAWPNWQQWILQWPEVMPFTTLADLDLKVEPSGDLSAQLSVWIPQHVTSVREKRDDEVFAETETGPNLQRLDASAWAGVQLQARQHPSFAPWRAAELNRVRHPLESVSREQLHYIGHLEQAGRKLALLRVSPLGTTALTEVHAVTVGTYVGQDMGRIEVIESGQLRLRELVRDAEGAWHAQQISLPLKGAVP